MSDQAGSSQRPQQEQEGKQQQQQQQQQQPQQPADADEQNVMVFSSAVLDAEEMARAQVIEIEGDAPAAADDDDDDDDDAGGDDDGDWETVPDDDGAQDLGDDDEDDDDEDEDEGAAGTSAAAAPDEKLVSTFTEHSGSVFCVSLARGADGKAVAVTGGEDDLGMLWSCETGEALAELSGHKDSVAATAVDSSGTLAATGGLDAVVHVWRTASGEHVQKLEGPGEGIEWLSFHPRGPVVLAGCSDSTLWMWNAEKGQCMHVLAGHSERVSCGGFTRDGKKIYSGSDDGTVRIWDPKTGECESFVDSITGRRGNEPDGVSAIDCSLNSGSLLAGSSSGRLALIAVGTGKLLKALEAHDESVECIAYSEYPALSFVATASLDRRARVFDPQTGQVRCSCVHRNGVVRCRWVGNTPVLVTAGLRGELRMWDCRSGSCVREFRGHRRDILDVAVSAEHKVIVTASDDGRARVFRLD